MGAVLYADDALLLAESEEELQSMIASLQESTSSMDLKINVGKTKVIVISIVVNYSTPR
jgi:hydrogenase maturation factor